MIAGAVNWCENVCVIGVSTAAYTLLFHEFDEIVYIHSEQEWSKGGGLEPPQTKRIYEKKMMSQHERTVISRTGTTQSTTVHVRLLRMRPTFSTAIHGVADQMLLKSWCRLRRPGYQFPYVDMQSPYVDMCRHVVDKVGSYRSAF